MGSTFDTPHTNRDDTIVVDDRLFRRLQQLAWARDSLFSIVSAVSLDAAEFKSFIGELSPDDQALGLHIVRAAERLEQRRAFIVEISDLMRRTEFSHGLVHAVLGDYPGRSPFRSQPVTDFIAAQVGREVEPAVTLFLAGGCRVPRSTYLRHRLGGASRKFYVEKNLRKHLRGFLADAKDLGVPRHKPALRRVRSRFEHLIEETISRAPSLGTLRSLRRS